MQPRTPRALVAAAALALFASACTDAPTASSARTLAPGTSALSASEGQPALIPNSVKYRDAGGKPATGRSGSAELEVLALLAKDGTTTVQSHARHVDPAVQDTGTVSKLQVKALAADGQVKFARNLNGDESAGPMVLGGLARGDKVQLQANVRGLDGSRTDVVTVTETVKRRADLGIRMATAPAGRPGVPTVIMATVTEHNGDVGTRATCELLVQGQVVDDARGIWVDAGDNVRCAFTHTFAAPGSYTLTARVMSDGGDWDEANNVDSATLPVQNVGGGTTAFATEARFEQVIFTDTTWMTNTWRDLVAGHSGEEGEIYTTAQWDGISVMWGSLDRALAGPVRFEVSSAFGGGAPVTSTWVHYQAGYGQTTGGWCADYWGPGAVYICSNGDGENGSTTLEYWGFAAWGTTYHSIQYGRAWDEATGTELYRYHFDYGEYLNGVKPMPMGDSYTWRVHMSAANGEFLAEKTMPLRTVRQIWASPRECWTDVWPDYSNTHCENRVSVAEWTESY